MQRPTLRYVNERLGPEADYQPGHEPPVASRVKTLLDRREIHFNHNLSAKWVNLALAV